MEKRTPEFIFDYLLSQALELFDFSSVSSLCMSFSPLAVGCSLARLEKVAKILNLEGRNFSDGAEIWTSNLQNELVGG